MSNSSVRADVSLAYFLGATTAAPRRYGEPPKTAADTNKLSPTSAFARPSPPGVASKATEAAADSSSVLNDKKNFAMGMMYSTTPDKSATSPVPPVTTPVAPFRYPVPGAAPQPPAPSPAPALAPAPGSLAEKLAKARGGMTSTPEAPEPAAPPALGGPAAGPLNAKAQANALAGAIAKAQFNRGLSKVDEPSSPSAAAGPAQKSETDLRWEELERAFKRPLKLNEMDFTDLVTGKTLGVYSS